MKAIINIQILVLIGIMFSACHDSKVPVTMLKGFDLDSSEVLIKVWQIIGPIKIDTSKFENKNKIIDIEYSNNWDLNESEINDRNYIKLAKPNMGIPGLDSCYKDTLYQTNSDHIFFNKVFNLKGDSNAGVCYAACVIESEKEQDVAFLSGCDDAIKIWVNNKLVKRKVELFSETKLNDVITSVHLKKGRNFVLVKVFSIQQQWSFYLALSSLKYAHDYYLNKTIGNFLTSSMLTQNDSLNFVLDKLLLQHIDKFNINIKDVNKKTIISKIIKFDCDSNSICIKKLCINKPYWADLVIEKDTIYQMFFYGDSSVFLSQCKEISKTITSSPVLSNINALLYRYNFLSNYGERVGFDEYLRKKIVFLFYELGYLANEKKQNENLLKHIPGLHIRTYFSKIDKQEQHYQIYIPRNYNKEKPLPLVVEAPVVGEVKHHFLESWHVADLMRINMLSRLADKHGVAYLWPNSRVIDKVNYYPLSSSATLEAIEAVKLCYNIDTNSLFLYGSCWAGSLAAVEGARFPDKYAALGLQGPSLTHFEEGRGSGLPQVWTKRNSPFKNAENFIDEPVYIIHARHDDKADYKLSYNLTDEINFVNGKVVFKTTNVTKKKGVNLLAEDDFLNELYPWFLSCAKKRNNDSIHFSTWENKYNNEGRWVKVIQKSNKQKAILKASVKENVIKIDTENISTISIDPFKIASFNKERPLTVLLNNNNVFESKVNTHPIEIGNLDYQIQKNCYTEGPINDVFGDSFLVICGTKARSVSDSEAIEKCSQKIVDQWNKDFYTNMHYLSDRDITLEDLNQNNLVLVGDYQSNAILQQMKNHLPLKIGHKKLILDGREFKGDNIGCIFVYPNPKNKKKYVLVISGNNLENIKNMIMSYWYYGFYDYYVLNTLDSTVIEMGDFNINWKL